MKNPYDVLRVKEQELLQVRKEVESLRVAARLLEAEDSRTAKIQGEAQLQAVEMP